MINAVVTITLKSISLNVKTQNLACIHPVTSKHLWWKLRSQNQKEHLKVIDETRLNAKMVSTLIFTKGSQPRNEDDESFFLRIYTPLPQPSTMDLRMS